MSPRKPELLLLVEAAASLGAKMLSSAPPLLYVSGWAWMMLT